MVWALLSVLAGLGDAISFAFIKKLGNFYTYVKLIFYNLFVLLFLLLGFLFYNIPNVSSSFYIVVVINVIIWLIAFFIFMRALQMSDLSTSIPMLSFTPIFLLFVSFVLLSEFPTILGLLGIFVVVIGSYLLNISSIKYGYFEPFKLIFKNKGVFYMLIVSFLFSITTSLSKIGIGLSNPAYFMFIHYLFASIILIILFFKKIQNNKKIIKKNLKYFFIIGIAVALSELFAATALKFAIVPYVSSLKRSSVIFSVIIGFLFFKERNFKEKILGALLMFFGAMLIVLF